MARKKKQKLTEEFLTSHATDRFDASNNWRSQEVEPRWKDSNDLYDSNFKTEEENERSDVLLGNNKLFIPKTYTHTQRILVDILEAFFFDPEEIVSVGTWQGVPEDHKRMVKTLLNYRLNSHPIDFYQEAYEASLDSIRNKIGVMKVFPKFSGKNNKGFTPEMITLPFEDVFFESTATWKNYHQKTIIHRMLLPLDHLKRQKYKNLEMFEPVQDPTGTDEIKSQRAEDQGSPFNLQSEVQSSDLVYVYDVWTHLDMDGDDLLESANYLMGGDEGGPKFVIRDAEENKLPYKIEGEDYNRPPIVVGSAFPESHKMYGKDLPEIVEDLQRETNSLRNQRREAVALGLRPPTLVMRGSGVDLMSLVNRRIGGVVLGNDISSSSIREMDVKDATSGSYRESAVTDQDFFEATSISPNQLGVSSPGEQSATESVALDANANKKIALIIKNLAQTLFVPAFKMLLRLEQEYESDEFLEKVAGRVLGVEFGTRDSVTGKIIETSIKKKRDIIQGDFELKVNVGINKQAQLNKWFLLMDRANQSNASTANMVQLGVVAPENAEFISISEIFDRVFPVLGEKDLQAFKIKAQPPPLQEGGTTVPGVASQPALPSGQPIQAVSNLNPEGF